MKLTFEDKLILAEKTLQEITKEGDPLRIALARVSVQYAKAQISNSKRATTSRGGR